MKLIKGRQYQYWYIRAWVYGGEVSGKCHQCGKAREVLYQFHAQDKPADLLKLGSECVKEMRLTPNEG